MNKKTYSMPQIEVVEKEVGNDLLLVISNAEVSGSEALTPVFDDAELEVF